MSVIISAENEAFKLRINAEDKTAHNFKPGSRSVDLSVCRNSFAAFQIVMQCDFRCCVKLNDAPWFSEYSDAGVLTIRHEGEWKPVMNHIGMYLADDGYLYGDCLRSDPVADAEADVPAGVFVRFEIPKDMAPGKYSGVFKVFSTHLFEDEVLVDSISYTVTVKDIVLPDPKDHSFSLDLWQHNCNIARKAGVANWCDRHFEIMEQYIKTLAALGQSSVTAIVSEIPWSGQRCFQNKETPSNMFEYSMVSVQQEPDGSYTYDYSVLDRYIQLCFGYGIDKKIEVFGLINNWVSVEDGFLNFTETPEAIRIRYRMPDGSFRYMKKASDIEDYIKALYRHFLEKGWLDKVRVVADEPTDYEKFRISLDMVKRLAPGFRYKAAFGKKSFYDEFQDTIEDFCVILTGLTTAAEEWRTVFKEDKKHNFTFYVCCFPRCPNTYLFSDLLETRYLAILADYFRLSGFLRWNYTVWPRDPRYDIRYYPFPAGDTNFVYPGGDMQPLLSLRYMALRRSMEDYELLAMLRDAGQERVVEEMHRSILTNRQFSQFHDEWNTFLEFEEMSAATYQDYEKMRREMYNALEMRPNI